MKLIEPRMCSGCGACQAICAKNAIQMKIAADGFKYPQIDEQRCVNCGKCIGICREREAEERNFPLQTYAAVGRDDRLVKRSASGGVFASAARSCAAAGGLAAGAVMGKDETGFYVRHKLSDQSDDLAAMQGSKYVQSDAWECYEDVLKAVRSGKQVLFSGTPCQVSAIKRLTGDPENLITMDLVCHGVPSMRTFSEYAEILGRRFMGTLCDIRFRDKGCGKHYYAEIGINRFGKRRAYHLSSGLMSFYKMFLSGVIQRESCYECPYANLNRVSDITIGDYWGVEEMHAADFAEGRMKKRSDWSCVLVNTEKGRKLIQNCADKLELFPSQAEWAAEKNGQLKTPSRKPAEREVFLRRYAEGGYAEVEKEFIRAYGGKCRYYRRLIKNALADRGKRL